MNKRTAEVLGQKNGRLCLWSFIALILGVLVWQPAASAPHDVDLVIVLPDISGIDPSDWPDISDGDSKPFDPETGEPIGVVARGTIGTVNVFELSPENLSDFATGQLTIGIYSPWGWFPRYRIRARLLNAPPVNPGSFVTSDIGMGVRRVIARSPRINPIFDYDPSTVSKDVDEEPIFDGTVGNLGATPRLLYRTRGFYIGSWNYFTLRFAVGPQYYTPEALVDTEIEVILELV